MSFSFVTLAEVCDAELAYNSLQGSEINIGFKQHLYLSYVDQGIQENKTILMLSFMLKHNFM